jgi:hypothetical protein
MEKKPPLAWTASVTFFQERACFSVQIPGIWREAIDWGHITVASETCGEWIYAMKTRQPEETHVKHDTYKKPTITSTLSIVLTMHISNAEVRVTTDAGQRSHDNTVLQLDGTNLQGGR